jgi:ATP-binding cassette, subfamily B, bacterial HlyB/CyaB
VLVASFFLQLFSLVSPLFFQVVIDKVLVSRTLGTLDVIMIGLVSIAVFETVLSILRTYLFAHTTNRIDVELGARLFRHLMALPIGYFQSRRVGDSVARVRELENIRNFLTGSALTLVIDLVLHLRVPRGDVHLLPRRRPPSRGPKSSGTSGCCRRLETR